MKKETYRVQNSTLPDKLSRACAEPLEKNCTGPDGATLLSEFELNDLSLCLIRTRCSRCASRTYGRKAIDSTGPIAHWISSGEKQLN
jgi:hypothetical protein